MRSAFSAWELRALAICFPAPAFFSFEKMTAHLTSEEVNGYRTGAHEHLDFL